MQLEGKKEILYHAGGGYSWGKVVTGFGDEGFVVDLARQAQQPLALVVAVLCALGIVFLKPRSRMVRAALLSGIAVGCAVKGAQTVSDRSLAFIPPPKAASGMGSAGDLDTGQMRQLEAGELPGARSIGASILDQVDGY